MTCSKCKKQMKRDTSSNLNTALAKLWVCPNCGHRILEETDK
jgi:DNA-directed RNA polymerase subunit RPC12/RpoP